MTRGRWLAALPAFLVPLPLTIYNPDFARTPGQWGELFAVSLASLATIWGTAWVIERLRAGSSKHVPLIASWLWLVAALGLVGWIIGGVLTAVAAPLAALCGAVLARVTGRLQWGVTRNNGAILAGTCAGVLVLSGVAYDAVWPRAIKRQVVMIGLDGTTWRLVNQFRASGRLPNLDRLIASGASAEMDTLDPILSPPIWTSIATGKRPQGHGVRDFWASSSDVKAKPIWEITDEAGLLTGVYGYLVTWPPKPISGFMVPGWTAQGDETWPPELSFIKRLERTEKSGTKRDVSESIGIGLLALRNGITLATLNEVAAVGFARSFGQRDDEQIAVDNRRIKLAFNSDVYCHFLRTVQPEFSIFYDSAIDATQHLFFKYFEPAGFPSLTREKIAQLGDAIPFIYERADAVIGRITENMRDDADLVVVSDHGQQVDPTGEGNWYAIHSSRFLSELGLTGTLLATNVGAGVYLRAAGETVDPATIETAWRTIGELVTPAGKPVIKLRVGGPTEAKISVADDFDLNKTPVVEFRGRKIDAAALMERSGSISGIHIGTAFFLMRGPSIRAGAQLARGNILDVAPTVLALLGLATAHDAEGRARRDGFLPGFVAAHPEQWVDSYGAPRQIAGDAGKALDDNLVENLKTLGYIQ